MKFKKVILALLPVLLLLQPAVQRRRRARAVPGQCPLPPAAGNRNKPPIPMTGIVLRQYREAQKRGAGERPRLPLRRSRKKAACLIPCRKNLYSTACYAILPLSERPSQRRNSSAGGGHGQDFPEGIADAEVFPDRPGGGRGCLPAEPGPVPRGKAAV